MKESKQNWIIFRLWNFVLKIISELSQFKGSVQIGLNLDFVSMTIMVFHYQDGRKIIFKVFSKTMTQLLACRQ